MDRRDRDRMNLQLLCNQCLLSLMLSVRTPFMSRCTRYNIMW